MHRRFGIGIITCCALALAGLWTAPAAAQGAEPVCAKCHEENNDSIRGTAHGAKNDASGSMCQACHGDATEHVASRGKKPIANKLGKGHTAAQKSAVCLECHANSRMLAFWESGKHAKNDVSCSSCHSIHGRNRGPAVSPFTTTARSQVPGDPAGLKQADLCGTCHRQIRNATLKPSHHPIQEGKVKCTDCHNPHGALSHAMVKQETVNQQCFSCHADKRGPYVFNHPPVEENCLTCHTPHGSVHGKLLNEKAPNLCQDCHVTGRHPTNFYGSGQAWLNPDGTANSSVNTRFIARGCLNCHNAIHGSNAPSNRGQFLIR
jgi:DmsE family decaheme c-type cytochrome